MRVMFRSDASVEIGTGHVMRCLTLADALKAAGAECHFVCRAHVGHLLERIRQQGHQVHELPAELISVQPGQVAEASLPAHAHWLGADWQCDARQTMEIARQIAPDWLVVDHYALDAHWESALRLVVGKILVIDDLGDRLHVCDLLLDQTHGCEQSVYRPLVPAQCKFLLGTDYALLRPEFRDWRDFSLRRRRSPVLKRILVSLGGMDKENHTCRVLESLKQCDLPKDAHITVVMGSAAPWLDSVREKTGSMPWSTEVHVNVSNMAQLMAESDFCVGAAGSTTWERCALGIPAIVIILADNQRKIAQALKMSGAAILIDEYKRFDENGFFDALRKVMSDTSSLYKMSLIAREICDGAGTSKVAKIMFEKD